MQEDYLHYIWKHKKLNPTKLSTTNGERLVIKSVGVHNHDSGPDFFNAQLLIDNQLWAGNVEIHVKSSDWYVHGHETDLAYDNVILHVVWEHDVDVFRKDNSVIPAVELKHFVEESLLSKYKSLINSKSWIKCGYDFPQIEAFVFNNWLERVYIERLEQKSKQIEQLLKASNNDWEAVCFKMLFKNFGLKVNGEAFLSIANSIDFSTIRKLQYSNLQLEALFFGQAGLLETEIEDRYFLELQKQYQFIKQKFRLDKTGIIPLKFFRLRPPNFPTVRISQFSSLYASEQQLFSKMINLNSKENFYDVFKIDVSEYWLTHYTFSKVSKKSAKKLSKSFIDLLIINTIIPLQYAYAKTLGKVIDEKLFALIKSIAFENNTITSNFLNLRSTISKTALSSQSLLQLKQNYCDKNKCLQCAIGNAIISKK